MWPAAHEAGGIADYALFGAAAQTRYTEAVATFERCRLPGLGHRLFFGWSSRC